MLNVYGLTQCGTCKKARDWLDGQGIAYSFHDWKADGVPKALVAGWITANGPEGVLNKAGYTWRGLTPEDQQKALGPNGIDVFIANPSLIKRPVFVGGKLAQPLFGFSKKVQDALA